MKFTHISDNYFDLASQGILRNTSANIFDDFVISDDDEHSEIKTIKTYYRTLKREHSEYRLPNMSGLTKSDFLNLLTGTKDRDAIAFVEKINEDHASYVPSDSDELYPLEWWNYKYQGERLFCNNNRLFVFLSYKNRIIDGRELKGKTTAIGAKISALLDNISKDRMHTVHYHYDKDPGLVGDYTALSLSAIYTE